LISHQYNSESIIIRPEFSAKYSSFHIWLLSDLSNSAEYTDLLVAIGKLSGCRWSFPVSSRETKAAIASPIVQIVSSKEPTARKSTDAVSSYVPSLLTLSRPFRGHEKRFNFASGSARHKEGDRMGSYRSP